MTRKQLKAQAEFLLNQLYALESNLAAEPVPPEAGELASIAARAMRTCLSTLTNRSL